MSVLVALLYVVVVISSFLLIGVIFIQKSKGGGFGSGFGAAMGESMFGTHAAKALVKMTIILSSVFVVSTVLIAKLTIPPESSVDTLGEEEKKPPVELPTGQIPGAEQPPALPSGIMPAPAPGAAAPSTAIPAAPAGPEAVVPLGPVLETTPAAEAPAAETTPAPAEPAAE